MPEQYSYDGDNERLTRVHAGVTTVYLAGVQEGDVVSGVVTATRKLYPFAGQVVAERNGGTLYYLHGDHLGSVGVVSSATGGSKPVSQQDYDPWGQVRTSPPITQTTLNYTGQRLDGSGLLYYHARYYDPGLARWTSADTLVPGMASGKGGMPASVDYDTAMALMSLTADFHEGQFTSALHEETRFTYQKGFWFQLSSQDQQKAKYPWGPSNPQTLNRYSYVIDNPLGYTDPLGHIYYFSQSEARDLVNNLIGMVSSIGRNVTSVELTGLLAVCRRETR